MDMIASQITSLTIVYLTVYSAQIKENIKASSSLAFVWGIHRWSVNSPHKWPVTQKMFPFDDVIMIYMIESIPPAQAVLVETLKPIFFSLIKFDKNSPFMCQIWQWS